MSERTPVTTKEELDTFEHAEVVEGYLDGFNGEPEPGDNRAKAYWHGWRNGYNDRNRTVDPAQRALARALGVGRKPPADAARSASPLPTEEDGPGTKNPNNLNQVLP